METGIVEEMVVPRKRLSQKFYQNDPFLSLLKDHLRLSSVSYAMWIAAASLLVLVLVPYLLPGPKSGFSPGMAYAQTGLLEACVILPLGGLLYILIPDLFAELVSSLEGNGVIDAQDPRYQQFIQRMALWVSSPAWTLLGALSVIAYWLFRLSYRTDLVSTLPVSDSARMFYRILELMLYSPVLFGASVTVGRMLSGLFFSGQLFYRFDLNINPLHEDQVGGLNMVGRNLIGGILFATVIGFAAIGLNLSMQNGLGLNDSNRPEVLALKLIYVLLVPLFFFCWLWAPHQALLKARQRLLRPLADEFKTSLAYSTKSLKTTDKGDDAASLKSQVDRLMEIKRQYDFLQDAFPTWPLPNRTVKNLIATASLPTIPPVLAILLPMLFPGMPDFILKILQHL